jgi:hypothetical protein
LRGPLYSGQTDVLEKIEKIMKTKTILATAACAMTVLGRNVQAQTYQEYQFIFSGTAYKTNALGNIVGTHITEQTLLADRAKQGNITDLSTISMVYHINGNSLGDTVEVISNATRQTLTTEFGFYFGSDGALGRTAVTNLLQMQERRVDYIYTFDSSTYTYANSDSVGAAFTYKDFVKAGSKTNAIISGTMSWDAIPTEPNAGPVVCTGTFSLGQPVH